MSNSADAHKQKQTEMVSILHRNANVSGIKPECFARICGRELYIRVTHPQLCFNLMDAFTVKKTVRDKGKYFQQLVPLYGAFPKADCVELITLSGFAKVLIDMCNISSVPLELVELIRNKDKSTVTEPVSNLMQLPKLELPRLEEFYGACRDWQQKAFPILCNYRYGQIKVSTGGGKSFLIALFSFLATGLRICVTTGDTADLDNLYRAILKLTGDVLKVTASNAASASKYRIVCCTTRSLHHIRDQHFDIMLADEVHKMAGPSFRQSLWTVKARRAFGFSANVNERADKADSVVVGMFGPCVLERSYEENLADNDVVPIYYRFIQTGSSRTITSSDASVRKRNYIVQNNVRNQAFADIARYYHEQGKQVLVMCETVEHVLRMWNLLPEAVGVYRAVSADIVTRMKNNKMWDPKFPLVYSPSLMREVQDAFASRELTMAIANSVWHKGKDFPSLDVTVRTDAISTKEACTQIGGRLARKGKAFGLLIDGLDEFDNSMSRNSGVRESVYISHGWKSWEESPIFEHKQPHLF